MAGLTVVRTTFRNVPIAIEIAREYSDELWVKDSRFENVSSAAVLVSNERNAMTQVGFENAVCIDVPTFARLRESGRTFAGRGPAYRVARFNHGLVVSPARPAPSILATTLCRWPRHRHRRRPPSAALPDSRRLGERPHARCEG